MSFDSRVDRNNTDSLKWDLSALKYGDKMLPLWVADMDFKSPDPVIRALKNRAEHGVFGYTLQQESYFEPVARWYNRRHRMDINTRQILYSPGICAAISMFLRTFTNPGDRVLIQSPIYYPFFQLVEENGRVPVFNVLTYEDGIYTIDFDDFEQKAASGVKIFLLCSPHNPTGRVWTAEELDRMRHICKANDILVISDEIHCDIIFPGARHIPFITLDKSASDHCITCTAPSKTFNLAGLATSHVFIKDGELKKAYQHTLHASGIFGASAFGAEAVKAAYTEGEPWLNELLIYLEENLTVLTEFIKNHMSRIRVVKPQGTYLVWLDFRDFGLSHEKISRLLIEEGNIWLNDGHIFGPGGEGFERINIACPRSILIEGLERIKKAVNTISG